VSPVEDVRSRVLTGHILWLLVHLDNNADRLLRSPRSDLIVIVVISRSGVCVGGLVQIPCLSGLLHPVPCNSGPLSTITMLTQTDRPPSQLACEKRQMEATPRPTLDDWKQPFATDPALNGLGYVWHPGVKLLICKICNTAVSPSGAADHS
jgi:hypothetical protein